MSKVGRPKFNIEEVTPQWLLNYRIENNKNKMRGKSELEFSESLYEDLEEMLVAFNVSN